MVATEIVFHNMAELRVQMQLYDGRSLAGTCVVGPGESGTLPAELERLSLIHIYRRLFEAAADGLILQDLETGLVVEANPAAYVLYGYAREEFIGLHPRAFMPSDGDAHFDEWAKTCLLYTSRCV